MDVALYCLRHVGSLTHKCVAMLEGTHTILQIVLQPPAGTVSNEPLGASYVDGISITYGTPPTHIWSFAAGPVESGSSGHVCPCNVQPGISAPLYVGNDYYCESGTLTNAQSIWYTSDPLWDGMQCGGEEGPCCNRTGLPWFNKNLSTPTTATITTRALSG